jgi:hypothetical protein
MNRKGFWEKRSCPHHVTLLELPGGNGKIHKKSELGEMMVWWKSESGAFRLKMKAYKKLLL